MTAPWARCCRCEADLYPRLARRTEDGWACADYRACAKRTIVNARREDIRYMTDTGECATGAARRLEMSRDALQAFCRRQGLQAEWRRLTQRDPCDYNNLRGSNRQWKDERKAS